MLRSRVSLLLLVIFSGLFAQIFGAIWVTGADVGAESSWSWVDASPTVLSMKDEPAENYDGCQSTYGPRAIDGELDKKPVCYSTGDKLSLGWYYINAWGGAFSVVGFPGDDKMYRIDTICGGYSRCLYLPDTDTLVTKQSILNSWSYSLVVYKNFSKKIRASRLDGPIPSIVYSFDQYSPDYIFRSSLGFDGYLEGRAWSVGSMSASKNGKWLAVEFIDRGIGLLNIETLQMKRIAFMTNRDYGYGFSPTKELAVSNNGRSVAVMGMNAGSWVFDVVDGCSEVPPDDDMLYGRSIGPICPARYIDLNNFASRINYASSPSLNDDGGQLAFNIRYFDRADVVRRVTLQAGGYSSVHFDYIALGDSFTSGEGELEDRHYQSGTNDEFEKCHLSTRSYPYLVTSYFNLNIGLAKSVACSGATMADIVGNDSNYWGQGGRLGVDGLDVAAQERTRLQSVALDDFVPGRVHQISFVKRYQPRVISVGIGGNDAGFIQKLQACLAPDTCEWAGTAKGREKTAVEIRNLFSRLVETYTEIHQASPESRIYAIGYPKIIDTDGKCDAPVDSLLGASEKQFMNEGIKYLNQVISAAARRAGVKYVDVYDSFGDSTLCGDAQPSSMNAIRLGDDNSPLTGVDWLKFIGQESFHPTPTGHVNVASDFVSVISGAFVNDISYCAGYSGICPDDSVRSPEPSSYWVNGEYHNYPVQKVSSYIADNADDSKKTISLASGSLQPNSEVQVEVASHPEILGKFVTTANGALEVEFDMPIGLSSGYHTIHVLGTDPSGVAVDLYQVIYYQKPEPPKDGTTPIVVVEKVDDVLETTDSNSTQSSLKTNFVSDLAGSVALLNDTAVQGASSNGDDNKPSGTVATENNDIVYMMIIVISWIAIAFILWRQHRTKSKTRES